MGSGQAAHWGRAAACKGCYGAAKPGLKAAAPLSPSGTATATPERCQALHGGTHRESSHALRPRARHHQHGKPPQKLPLAAGWAVSRARGAPQAPACTTHPSQRPEPSIGTLQAGTGPCCSSTATGRALVLNWDSTGVAGKASEEDAWCAAQAQPHSLREQEGWHQPSTTRHLLLPGGC